MSVILKQIWHDLKCYLACTAYILKWSDLLDKFSIVSNWLKVWLILLNHILRDHKTPQHLRGYPPIFIQMIQGNMNMPQICTSRSLKISPHPNTSLLSQTCGAGSGRGGARAGRVCQINNKVEIKTKHVGND